MTSRGATVLFEGQAFVSYSQIYVMSDDVFASDPFEANAGQVNGLCGAAVPGALFLTTGLHTGSIGFKVERYDERPAVDDSWEEIVEASFRAGAEVRLVQWAGEESWPLDLRAKSYRVRYCAKGMQAGREVDTLMVDEPLVDHYLLQFWPAEPAPDAVLKQTTEIAAYWHSAWNQARS